VPGDFDFAAAYWGREFSLDIHHSLVYNAHRRIIQTSLLISCMGRFGRAAANSWLTPPH
jgi:hypothetical protein